jgi:hypothetical protein
VTAKVKKLAFGAAVVIAVIILVVAIPVTYGMAAISRVVMDVWVPNGTSAPRVVPYDPGHNDAVVSMVMTESDAVKIKQALSRTRVLIGFYSKGIVTVETTNMAKAVFWRRNIVLTLMLAKVGDDWKVVGVSQLSGHYVATKDLWGRILDAASKVAP